MPSIRFLPVDVDKDCYNLSTNFLRDVLYILMTGHIKLIHIQSIVLTDIIFRRVWNTEKSRLTDFFEEKREVSQVKYYYLKHCQN